MPLLKVNAAGERPDLSEPADLDAALARELAALPAEAPVVILIHGYKFSPATPHANPHTHILSLTPRKDCWKAISWPRHLGFGKGQADEGLCIAFGWEARGTIWQAWDRAESAGTALADLVRRIRGLRPGPVDVLAHSLGARVVLAAMARLPARSIGRAVLLAAAEFRSRAARAIDTPAGRSAEVINITSRENDLFDVLVEWLVRAPESGDPALGAGLGRTARNWLDVQMDCADTRRVLCDFGYRIPAPQKRICHWSAYLRPGLFALYSDLIRDRHALPLACLRQMLPDQTAPRWSRLLQVPQPRLPLPFVRNASL